ncbi:MAG: hypothetical protein II184_08085, partial [Clostridia bacterium]|nr:hypothetical protein [Clostridia bacterium]
IRQLTDGRAELSQGEASFFPYGSDSSTTFFFLTAGFLFFAAQPKGGLYLRRRFFVFEIILHVNSVFSESQVVFSLSAGQKLCRKNKEIRIQRPVATDVPVDRRNGKTYNEKERVK